MKNYIKSILIIATLVLLCSACTTQTPTPAESTLPSPTETPTPASSFSSLISETEKFGLGFSSQDIVYRVSSVDLNTCSALFDGTKNPADVFSENETAVVSYTDDGSIYSTAVVKITANQGNKYDVEYRDYTKSIYSNALNLQDNILTQKYNDINIEDIYIFAARDIHHMTTDKTNGCFYVYYKTDKGDFIFFKHLKSSPYQYLAPYSEYVEAVKRVRNSNTYGLVGPDYEFMYTYKAEILGGPELVTADKLEKIKVGMSYSEVADILGEGIHAMYYYNQDIYEYKTAENKYLRLTFDKGSDQELNISKIQISDIPAGV